LSYLANRQTDRQTKTGKNIISLAEVINVNVALASNYDMPACALYSVL